MESFITHKFEELPIVVGGLLVDSAMLTGEADIDDGRIETIRMSAEGGRTVTLERRHGGAIFHAIAEAIERTCRDIIEESVAAADRHMYGSYEDEHRLTRAQLGV